MQDDIFKAMNSGAIGLDLEPRDEPDDGAEDEAPQATL